MRDTQLGGRPGIGRSRRLTATAVAVAAAVASLAPLTGGTAVAADTPTTAVATTPAPLTIPAETYPSPGAVHAVGTSGFLHENPQGYTWVSYADGKAVPYDMKGAEKAVSAGGDVIARLYGAGTTTKVVFQEGPAGPETTVAIPRGQHFRHVQGRRVITTESTFVHVLSVENGVVTDRKVAAPAGAAGMYPREAGTERGFFVTYEVDRIRHTGWLDLAGLTVRPTGVPSESGPTNKMGGARFFGSLATIQNLPGQRLTVWDTAGDLSKPVKDVPWTGNPVGALVGDEALVVAEYRPGERYHPYVLRPLDGGADRPAFDASNVYPAPDGGVLAVVKGGDGRPSIDSVRFPQDGSAPVRAPVYDTPLGVVRTERVAVAQGVVHSSESWWNDMYGAVTTRNLTVGGELAAGPKVDREYDPEAVIPGDCRQGCEPIVPTGDGRFVFRSYPGNVYVVEEGKTLHEREGTAAAPAWGSVPLQASGRYVSYTGEAGHEVFDLDAKKVVFRAKIGDRRTSLDANTLWIESTTTGAVDAVDVRTGATKRTVKLAACDLTGLQVNRSFAYWKCASGAGVKNLGTQAATALPAHTSALLGDGYVAHEKGGTLSVTPLVGAGTTRTVGTVGDSVAGRGWTVDRFGGHVTYVDAEENVHVVPSGVPASALTPLDTEVPGILDRRAAQPVWSAKWWLSKPAASWRVDVRNQAGTVVRTLGGGEARGLVTAAWDGKDTTGTVLPDGLYDWTLTAVPADGAGPALTRTGGLAVVRGQSELATGRYEPVTPARVMNTLDGTGVPRAKVGAGKTVTLTVAGRGGVPAKGVSAVVLNVTATNATAGTYVSVYPYGTPRPGTSNLNVTAGRAVPNLVVVPVRDGKVTFYNRNGSLDLLADVAGYYTLAGTGSLYEPVTPARVMSTLSGTGVPQAKLGADRTVTLTVAGRGGVPAAGVTAVVLNVTATNATAGTYVSVYPYGTTRPGVSNLNVVAGQTVPNLVVVPVRDGKVTFYNRNGSLDLLADVAGYYTLAGTGSLYEPVTPARVMSTLDGTGVPKAKVGTGKTVTLTVAGRGGVPATGVTAVVLNVTATNPTSATYVSVYPYGTTRPGVSNLNVVAGQTVPNLVVVPVKDGKVTFYNHGGTVDLLADVAGYFAH
ncbi:FlgD immunoglobulin-like domain containing protein [Streptomyces roseoviridis]|uniref:FlgD immunoglobulin-like domain containing protein n=1 Tax=Streptomyces roseoviridis TaxID=67361 RepID=A0ABV5QK12_9ACTN